MNRRIVARLLSNILLIELVAMLPPLGISLYQAEWDSVRGFLLTIGVLLLCGGLLRLAKPQSKNFYAAEGFATTALAWIVISLFGALPFLLSGAIPNPVDAFFETVSGFTTTGASILKDVEILPMGLLYWRSFTHWLGGMGVLVFLLAVTTMEKGEGYALFLLKAESPGPIVGKLTPTIKQSAKLLYLIYVALSLIEVIFLLAGGMPLFDSLCTMFGTAGTGGFSIKNASMAGYDSYYLQNVVTIFMILFGTNFNIFFLTLVREYSQALHDEELRVYAGILAGATLLISINTLQHYGGFGDALHHAAFQVASIMTTTGYATTDFDMWPELSRTILVLLMMFGACAGSTGGGMKISRIVIAFKSVKKEISRMLHPRAVRSVQMNGKTLDNSVTKGVSVFMTVYFAVIAASFLIVSLDNLGMVTNATAVLSCVNNIGPGLELVGPTRNFSVFSPLSKLILSADMLLGRLEFFPLLILMTPSTWRKKRIGGITAKERLANAGNREHLFNKHF